MDLHTFSVRAYQIRNLFRPSWSRMKSFYLRFKLSLEGWICSYWAEMAHKGPSGRNKNQIIVVNEHTYVQKTWKWEQIRIMSVWSNMGASGKPAEQVGLCLQRVAALAFCCCLRKITADVVTETTSIYFTPWWVWSPCDSASHPTRLNSRYWCIGGPGLISGDSGGKSAPRLTHGRIFYLHGL